MENIAYNHAASSHEVPENIEIVPFRFDFNILVGLNTKKFSSVAAIKLLSISLTLFFLSSVGQALALEKTNIQKCLKQIDSFDAPVSGFYDSMTKSTVIKFQEDNKQTADSIVISNTQTNLQPECLSLKPASNQTNVDVLKLGSRSSSVKKLQQDLKNLNYLVINPNNYFGPITKDAVIKFQKDKGLHSNGIVDTKTADLIVRSLETANNSVGGKEVYLALGSRGAEVVSLQKRLKRLKYFTGDANGYYGASTRDAVVRFQQKMGLTVDGIVGVNTQQVIDKTIQQLKRVKSPSNSKILPLTVGSCSNGKCPNLRVGNKSRYVKYLQTRLRHWGYFRFNPNGNYDSRTVEAVKRFQKAKGLSVDGVVGSQTWDKIENPKAKQREAERQKIKKSTTCNKSVLQRGDKGECVAKLQNRLQKLGYFKGNPTTYFGGSTWEAVKQFQLNNELPPNGIVDSQTWKALKIDNKRYIVLVPVTSPYTLDEVRRFVPDAFIRNTKLGKFVQTGEFQYKEGAEQYSRYFLRDRGFNARVVAKDKL
ncbi:MAG: peptidoglycan-binding protein [Cyanobacteria bacterium P01_D01_bin.116]